MKVSKKYYFSTIAMLCGIITGFAQSVMLGKTASDTLSKATTILPVDTAKQQLFVIGDIIVSGNRKTKSYIVKRELTFKSGDSVLLPDLIKYFQRSKELLINSRLFNDVVIALKGFRGYTADVLVEVKERWYLFPVPYFKLIERNLSVWADRGYKLDRINYGLKFTQYNFTGRNDKLKLWLVTGYTRQLQLAYDQPYADKTLKHGFGVNASYSAQKEINAATVKNTQFFLRADSIANAGKFLMQNYHFSLKYSYRPALRTVHSFQLGYDVVIIDSVVRNINPKYFLTETLKLKFPQLSYSISYQNVDYVPYILKGFAGEAGFSQRGVTKDFSITQLSGRFIKAWALGKTTFYGLQGNATIKLPFNQPFFTQSLLGYGDFFLRGLEKYVIDGVAGVLLINTIRQKILDVKLSVGISKSHSVLPVRIFLKTYTDWGYSYNKYFRDNSLVNRMLYTTGVGLDVVTLYDMVLRVEYSFNQLGQNGVFLHVRNDF